MKKILVILGMLVSATGFSQLQAAKVTDIEKIIRESTEPMIINMWATTCLPCIQEIPYFQEEAKLVEKDSVRLLLVSLDFREMYPDGIITFMKKRDFTANAVWLNETNADYFCPKIDPKWSGAIPATLFVNNKKGYRKFVDGQLSHETLRKEIMAMLSQGNKTDH